MRMSWLYVLKCSFVKKTIFQRRLSNSIQLIIKKVRIEFVFCLLCEFSNVISSYVAREVHEVTSFRERGKEVAGRHHAANSWILFLNSTICMHERTVQTPKRRFTAKFNFNARPHCFSLRNGQTRPNAKHVNIRTKEQCAQSRRKAHINRRSSRESSLTRSNRK